MGQHVGIGMADEALVVRNLDAAQHQAAAFGELVDVPALADADGEGGGRRGFGHGVRRAPVVVARAASTASARAKSSG